jgi:hypothetical protein
VQKEFAKERKALSKYLSNDPLMFRFFTFFLFEEIPANNKKSDELYLKEVKRADIYVGLFGNEYRVENFKGISPTHAEYLEATKFSKYRLIFVKGSNDDLRSPKMNQLIKDTSGQVVRRRFNTIAELISLLYASLVQFLDERGLLRNEPLLKSV